MWESGKLDAVGRRLFVSLWMEKRKWRRDRKLILFYFIYLSVIAVSRGLFNSNHRPRSLA